MSLQRRIVEGPLGEVVLITCASQIACRFIVPSNQYSLNFCYMGMYVSIWMYMNMCVYGCI